MNKITSKPLIIRVFLSSPGDVNEERRIIYQEIDKFLFYNPEFKDRVLLHPVGWDRKGEHIPMEANYDPQSMIEKRLLKSSECDIVFVVLWSRMGQMMDHQKYIKPKFHQYEVNVDEKPEYYFSGTEWEYVQAMEATKGKDICHPHVFVFRRTPFRPPLNDQELEEYSRQTMRIANFFQQFSSNKSGYLERSYQSYNDVDTFRKQVRTTLSTLVDELAKNPPQEILHRDKSELKKRTFKLPKGKSPFPGLRSFDSDDKSIFFGRERETEELIEMIKKNNFVAVIGASGSGKSSVVKAGLLPALAQNAILLDDRGLISKTNKEAEWSIKSSDWIIVKMTPGETEKGGLNDPFDSFYEAMNKFFPKNLVVQKGRENFENIFDRPAWHLFKLNKAENVSSAGLNISFREASEQFQNSLKIFFKSLLQNQPKTCQFILLIDQFEELFTIVDGEIRDVFIVFIEHLMRCEKIKILITMRADFFHQTLKYPQLTEKLRSGSFPLAPPGLGALLEMIRRPAEIADLTFENDVAEKILVETDENIGGLPLMAYLLDQMYERCKDQRILTAAVYDELGGIKGAIGKRANEIMSSLNQSSSSLKSDLHLIFRELVEVDERGVPTRRRAFITDIAIDAYTTNLIQKLTDARLLVTNVQKNQDTGQIDEVVEVAHEALLSAWKVLSNWISERNEDFIIRRKVENAAGDWKSNNKEKSYLWKHEQLVPVYEAYKRIGFSIKELDSDIQDFIRPEVDRIIEELELEETDHNRRNEIGLRLSELGDTRRGLGLNDSGIPEIRWCEKKVPSGDVKIEGYTEVFKVASFFIAKYPITLTQFKSFIDAEDGFYNEEWWNGLDKNPRKHKPNSQVPEIGNHPAVWVSWFQAVAFCRWLSNKLGFQVRIPFEWEWQQAATGGNPEFSFPWGKDWNPSLCNSREAGLNTITSVGLYPLGKSPMGAEDMSGNIYEWCMNQYDLSIKEKDLKDEGKRTTRGGAYFVPGPLQETMSGADVVKTTTRLGDAPSAPANGRLRVTLRLVTDELPPNLNF